MLPTSALATHAASTTSPSYLHIPTMQVVSALAEEGWAVSSASEAKVRKPERKGFQRHILRFRNAENPIIIGGSVAELLMINSHDGTGAFVFGAGLFRFACCNGLIVSDGDFQWARLRHTGSLDAAICAAMDVADNLGSMVPRIQQMEAKEMTYIQRADFAQKAIGLRFAHEALHPQQVLECRREEDDRGTLWSTYNTVQENLVKGGMHGLSSKGQRRKISQIRGAARDLQLNSRLWDLAASYL
jgi:hypothetical protein